MTRRSLRDLSTRTWCAAGTLLMAVLAYLPALGTARGVMPADTKLYLSLDPGRLIAAAPSLWDSSQFGGWVTHQTIGYLWPTGPWYWAWDQLGAPAWAAQRLWVGTLFLAAGTGVWWCARRLGLAHRGAYAAGLVYMLSPYLLAYVSRTSVLLSPWAGLGWLVGLTILAARRGGWRYPAVFALVVATVGGINATALVLIAVAPLLWLAHAALVAKEVPGRRALAAGARIGGLSILTSLWWLVALAVQSRYGADVLAYSETISAVSSTSLGSEVLRGLGYWLFYGGDVTGRWTGASTPYLQLPGLIGLGFVLAALGMAGIVLVRWRERAFLGALVVAGTVLAVGAHGASPLAEALQGSARSTLVLALRSSTRAVPVVLLGLALGVAVLLTAWAPRFPRGTVAAAAAVGVLAVTGLPALHNGDLVDPVLRHPEAMPAWWQEVAADLDALPDGYRVLELPGAEFAAHRWGITVDPVLPGLTDRPTLARDLLPLGSPALMDLLYALDDRFQDGVAEAASIAPVARLLGADQLLFRGDVAFDRYEGPRPADVWAFYQGATGHGLGDSTTYGPEQPNDPAVAMEDEWALSSPRAGGSPDGANGAVPQLALIPVEQPQAIVRAVDGDRTVILAGNGDGVVDAAAAGLLQGDELLRYAADLDGADDVTPGSLLVVTDTNRKRAHQWRGSQDTTGFTEGDQQGTLVEDEADHRLPVFGLDGGGPAQQTLADQRGGVRATASAYGAADAYLPEDRAFYAVDGDPATAWRVGRGGPVGGETLRLDFDEPLEAADVTLTQLLEPANRAITEVRLRTEAGERTVGLGDASRAPGGETVTLPDGPTSWLEIEVVGDTLGRAVDYSGKDPVGFAEVEVDGRIAEEVVTVPGALLDELGDTSTDHPLAFVLTRQRVDASKRWRDDPEAALVRAFDVPTERNFTLTGDARRSARAGDAVLAELSPATPVAAVASSRLAGVPAAGGPAAVDGDPATAWQTAFGPAVGATLTVAVPEALTVDHLDLQVLADGRHSVPTSLTVSNGAEQRTVTVPAIGDDPTAGGPVPVSVSFPPLTGSTFAVTITGTRDVTTLDRHEQRPVVLPVGIAELGLPGLPSPSTAGTPDTAGFDSGCRNDLVTIDGEPLPVRITAAPGLVTGEAAAVEHCGAAPLTLAAGEHVVRAVPGTTTGIDIDRLVLTSAAGGEAAGPAELLPPAAAGGPAATVTSSGRTSRTVQVEGAEGPFWLVFGEGLNDGWKATVDGEDLGTPEPVDGGMNGWYVDPATTGVGPITIELTWEPQRIVWAGLGASALGVLACVVLVAWPRRRSAARPGVRFAIHGRRAGFAAAPRGRHDAATVLGWTPLLVGTAVVAVLTAASVHPLAAVPVAGAMVLAGRLPRLRWLCAAGALAAIVATGAFYVVRQWRTEPAAGFGWPSRFELGHPLALTAIAFLLADVVLSVLALRARPAATPPSAPDPPAGSPGAPNPAAPEPG